MSLISSKTHAFNGHLFMSPQLRSWGHRRLVAILLLFSDPNKLCDYCAESFPVDIHIHILIPMLFSLWFHYLVLICPVSLQSVMVRDVYPICLFFFFLKFASALCLSSHECLSLCVFPSDVCFLSVNELNFVSKYLFYFVGEFDWNILWSLSET